MPRRGISAWTRRARTSPTTTGTERAARMPSQHVFSVEFSPPRSAEGLEKLRATRAELAQVAPAFYSVTFGAGGSTREGTQATTLEMHAQGLHAVPHISCVASTR